jgi:hypothetical protein
MSTSSSPYNTLGVKRNTEHHLRLLVGLAADTGRVYFTRPHKWRIRMFVVNENRELVEFEPTGNPMKLTGGSQEELDVHRRQEAKLMGFCLKKRALLAATVEAANMPAATFGSLCRVAGVPVPKVTYHRLDE